VPTVALTRRFHFSAAHRYRRAAWDDARNEAAFGACARPAFHGHTYVCDVSVTGPVDAETGMLVDLRALDSAIAAVRGRYDHRNLTLDCPEFAEDDGRVPTTENLAAEVARRVQELLGDAATVARVRVAEEPGLWATWER
jgi:6-pyruvoyltetrahydropterin/6-carboxytetrahydropterin synthase